MHELTKENIERMNAKYKLAGNKGRKHVVFAPGDLFWLHLRKDRFPDLRKSNINVLQVLTMQQAVIGNQRCQVTPNIE